MICQEITLNKSKITRPGKRLGIFPGYSRTWYKEKKKCQLQIIIEYYSQIFECHVELLEERDIISAWKVKLL